MEAQLSLMDLQEPGSMEQAILDAMKRARLECSGSPTKLPTVPAISAPAEVTALVDPAPNPLRRRMMESEWLGLMCRLAWTSVTRK